MEPLTCHFCDETIAGIPLFVHIADGLAPICTQDCFRAVTTLSQASAAATRQLHDLRQNLVDEVQSKRQRKLDGVRRRLEALYSR